MPAIDVIGALLLSRDYLQIQFLDVKDYFSWTYEEILTIILHVQWNYATNFW